MSAAALKHSWHFRIFSKENIVSSPLQKRRMFCESLHNSGLAVPSPYRLYYLCALIVALDFIHIRDLLDFAMI